MTKFMARRQHDPGPTDVGLGCFFGGLCSCSTLPRSAWGSHLSITFTGRPHIALSRRSSARSRMDFPGKERHGADIQSKCLQGHRGQLFGAAAWFGPKHLVAHRKREKGEGPARNPLPSAVPGSSHRDRLSAPSSIPGEPAKARAALAGEPQLLQTPVHSRLDSVASTQSRGMEALQTLATGRGRVPSRVQKGGLSGSACGGGPPAVLRSGTFLPHAPTSSRWLHTHL